MFGAPSAPPIDIADFWSMPTFCSNGSRLMFWTSVKWKGNERHDPAGRTGLRHVVIHLPVLVAHRRWRRAGEVEEVIARRFWRLAFEVIALVEAVERRLNDALIFAFLDFLFQRFAFGAVGDVDQRWHPVERGE